MSEILPLQVNDNTNESTSKPKQRKNSPKMLDKDGKTSPILLDKDGKPCRACTAFRDFSSKQKSTSNIISLSENVSKDCPADVEILGRHTWTFLHTLASYYPEKPTTIDKMQMRLFLSTFSNLYPCWYCASHLQKYSKIHPPKLSNQFTFSKWMCDVHNDVNIRLGKPLFDCSKVNERWKDGPPDGSCD